MTNVEVLSLQKAEAVVILPAYREASRVAPEGFGLGPTIENYQKALEGEYGNAYGLVVVDDGSDDDTAEFAQNLGAQTISYETNRGRGHALKVGFLAVTSAMSDLDKKSVGYFDADGSYSSDTMLRLLDTTLSRKTDIAVAYRLEGADQHESRMRRIAHYGLNKVCETIAPTGTKDVNAGAKAFRADIARELWQQASLERWGAD